MDEPIVLQGLTKDYGKGFRAVDSLDLVVRSNSFVGFLGPNGAGKTTTIKMLTNLLTVTAGKAYLNGVDVAADAKRALGGVGAVVETPEFYQFLTPNETLEYLGELRGMAKPEIRRRSKEVLETVKMTDWATTRIGKFSKGMKQRVALAQALLHEPSIVILDEPTSGLDPRGMVEVRDVLKELKKQKYTVFMSSHLLNEVQEVCTDVAMIDHGRLLAYDSVGALLSKIDSKKLEVRIANRVMPEAMDQLRRHEGVQMLNIVNERQFFIDFIGDEERQAQLLLRLQELGYRVVSFRESGVALENLYMSLIKSSR
ncbi:MAG: ABC transporter ATP-binding protein [Methanomassiliicoccales archaeon]|jgi:ABC-2 type transport system ATP-binding protein|nr:ABC transporter ATP-binding protein [Methanomassiliicoccales archaeon]